MNDEHGRLTERGTLVFRRVLPGPIERVWEYLTDPARRATWLAGGDMELHIGGRVELVFHNNELSPGAPPPNKYRDFGDRVSFEGHVTRCEPPYILAYSWAESLGDTSEVTFELSREGDKVALLLTHRRLGDGREKLLGVSAGWHTHLGILVDMLSNRSPKPFWPEHIRFETDYAKRFDQVPNVN